MFKDDDTFITRHIKNKNNTSRYFIAYCDGVVNSEIINDYIIKPLILSDINISKCNNTDDIIQKVLFINETKASTDLDEIIQCITYGDGIFVDTMYDYSMEVAEKENKAA